MLKILFKKSHDVPDEVLRAQKKLANSIIIPLMSVLTLVYLVIYFRPTVPVIAVYIGGVINHLQNLYFSKKERFVGIGKWKIHTFDSRFICARWVSNLAIGLICIPIVGPPVSAAVAIWTTCMVTAQMETFKNRHRYIIYGFGVVAFPILCRLLDPEIRVGDLLFVSISMGLLVLAFLSMECPSSEFRTPRIHVI